MHRHRVIVSCPASRLNKPSSPASPHGLFPKSLITADGLLCPCSLPGPARLPTLLPPHGSSLPWLPCPAAPQPGTPFPARGGLGWGTCRGEWGCCGGPCGARCWELVQFTPLTSQPCRGAGIPAFWGLSWIPRSWKITSSLLRCSQIVDSQNCLGWKGPHRSSSPTPLPWAGAPSLDQVAQSPIQPVLQHFQASTTSPGNLFQCLSPPSS